MKPSVILSTILFSFLIFSCSKPKINSTSVKIQFKGTFGNENLVIGEKVYDYSDKTIKFSRVSFYVANLKFANQDKEIDISDIEFIDFTKTHTSENEVIEGAVIEFDNIPIGDYENLKFDVGVPSNLNASSPADYSADHPLGSINNEEYSENFNGYIFARLEGYYDVNGENIFFTYHAGLNRDYQEIEIKNLISLKENESKIITLELNIEQLFSLPANNLIQIIPSNSDESIERITTVIIMDNFKNAIEIK